MTGRAEVHDSAEVLGHQLAQLDPDLPEPAEIHTRQLPLIRGLRLPLTRVVGKAKYGANGDEAQRAFVRDKLLDRRGPGDVAAAQRFP